MSSHYFFNVAKKPIYAWLKGGIPLEEEALRQVQNLADMPFIHHHVALMPDVHVGIGARLDKDILDESPAAYKDIGAGLGGGDWDIIEKIIEKSCPDIEVVVYQL